MKLINIERLHLFYFVFIILTICSKFGSTDGCELHERLRMMNGTILEMKDDVAIVQRCYGMPFVTIMFKIKFVNHYNHLDPPELPPRERTRQQNERADRFNQVTFSFLSRLETKNNAPMNTLARTMVNGIRIGRNQLGIGIFNSGRSPSVTASEIKAFSLGLLEMVNEWERFMEQEALQYCNKETVLKGDIK